MPANAAPLALTDDAEHPSAHLLPVVVDRFRVGQTPMNRSAATGIRNEALKAIEALSAALDVASRGCDEAEMGRLHKQVGL